MIGLIAIILIIVVFGGIGFVSGWLFAIWDERSGILSSPKRFLCYLLGLAVLFLVLFGDEIIGKMQFDALCRKAEFKLLVDEAELKDKKLISYRKKGKRIEYHGVRIYHYIDDYQDDEKGVVYFSTSSYYAFGAGWLSNIVTLGNRQFLIFSNKLDNRICSNPKYEEFKKKYHFSIIHER
ncbi:hypothetical protein [Neisseria yangbaofengii]|uniref:hypothetical protein n=1 Tax=Neisseria yangbaofengii TaxID=2709396 RepID=UPI0013EC8DC9|nr:hypothetical protein [Neisseria yangbaofengii]